MMGYMRTAALLVIIPLALTASSLAAHRAEILEIEPNNGLEDAQPISLPCIIQGSHSELSDDDFFAFSLTGSGIRSIYAEISAEGRIDPKLALLDGDGRILTQSDFFKADHEECLTSLLLEPGTYCLRVSRSSSREQPGIPYTLIVDEPPDVTADEVREALHKALDYLVARQNDDGGFTSKLGIAAMPGFAIQALLGAECVDRDDWATIYKAIDFVKGQVKNPSKYPEGYQRDLNGGGIFFHRGLYEHAICLTALIEAYAMGIEEDLPDIVRHGIDFLDRAQLTTERPPTIGGPIPRDSKYYGGWRYTANASDADLSVTGWQVIALTAARTAGFEVSSDRLADALRFVRRCYRPDIGEFAYMPDGDVATGRNAMGALSLQLLGAPDDSLVGKALRTILNRGPAWHGEPYGVYPFYYWYYGSRAAYLAGGEIWDAWKRAMCGMLVRHQKGDGSWELRDSEASKLDPVYGAAIGALILELCCGSPPLYLRTDTAPDRPLPPPRDEISVSLEHPTSRSRVQGHLEIRAVPVVPERISVAHVIFKVDGAIVGERTESPWTWTADLGPGVRPREIEVIAVNDLGTEASAGVVTAEGRDRVSVRITRPRGGVVTGMQEILLTASGDEESPLAMVTVEVNGETVLQGSEPPFSLDYDFGTVGGHSIVARARNALGSEATDSVTTREAPPLEVDITAMVMDSENTHILDLGREDFLVREDGVPQEILRFGREIAPVSMVILLDTSGSMTRHIGAVHEAAVQFVSQIRPVDRAAVITFADNARVVQGFTGDSAALSRAIRAAGPGGGTCLYDAVVAGCRQLQREAGRKAIILLTDGKDENKRSTGPGSKASFDEALEMAKEGDVTVYSLGLGKGIEKDILQQLSKATGGRAYFPPTVKDLAETYAAIAKDLQSHYSLGYSSTNRVRDRSWRSIEVSVPETGYTVRTKQGYYAR